MKQAFTLLLALLLTLPLAAQHSGLLPDYAKIQYAGNVGQFGVGLGYSFVQNKLEAELITGYLPAKYSHRAIWTSAVKGTYYPFSFDLKRGYRWAPIGPGVMITQSWGKEFFIHQPSPQYPEGYYTYSTSLQYYLLAAGYIEKDIRPYTIIKKIGLFYEWNMNGKEYFSWYKNMEQLGFDDFVSMAIGVRATF